MNTTDYIKSQDLERLYNNTKVTRFEISDQTTINMLWMIEKWYDNGYQLSLSSVCHDYGSCVSLNGLVSSFERYNESIKFDNQIKKIGITSI